MAAPFLAPPRATPVAPAARVMGLQEARDGRHASASLPALLALAAAASSAAAAASASSQDAFMSKEELTAEALPLWRRRAAAVIQMSAYKAITLAFVAVGLAALVHETGQRADGSEVEVWAVVCTRIYLVFSAFDLSLNVYATRTEFLLQVSNLLDVLVAISDWGVECFDLGGLDSEPSALAPWLRSIRAFRAVRGIRACCRHGEFEDLGRRMAATLQTVVTAAFVAAVLALLWAVVATGAELAAHPPEDDAACVDGSDDGDGADGCWSSWHSAAEQLMSVAWRSAKDSMFDLARAAVVGDLMEGGEHPYAGPCVALALAATVVKTAVDARVEAVATASGAEGGEGMEEADDVLWSHYGGRDGERPHTSPHEIVRAILNSLTAAIGSTGPDNQRRGDVARSLALLEADPATQSALAILGGSLDVGRPAAAAVAAAAAAGLGLALGAEELVRAQFDDLRREVEREVSLRCRLPPPVCDGGLLESAALGACRWLNGLSQEEEAACATPTALPFQAATLQPDVLEALKPVSIVMASPAPVPASPAPASPRMASPVFASPASPSLASPHADSPEMTSLEGASPAPAPPEPATPMLVAAPPRTTSPYVRSMAADMSDAAEQVISSAAAAASSAESSSAEDFVAGCRGGRAASSADSSSADSLIAGCRGSEGEEARPGAAAVGPSSPRPG